MGRRFELDPVHRWMLATLANYADPEGNDIYPSIGTLMADTGFSESTIRRHIKHLMLCGLMEYGTQSTAVMKIGRADRRPKVYRLCMIMSGPVDKPLNGVSERGVNLTGAASTGCQTDASRGVKRGVTVTPNTKNLKRKPSAGTPDPICRQCDRARPADSLSESGICSDCLGLGGDAAQEGAAYREQLRLRRLARTVGAMP